MSCEEQRDEPYMRRGWRGRGERAERTSEESEGGRQGVEGRRQRGREGRLIVGGKHERRTAACACKLAGTAWEYLRLGEGGVPEVGQGAISESSCQR